MCMTTLPVTHLAQASVAMNQRMHLASWALISRAWYPDATAAHLAQAIFLLMLKRQICEFFTTLENNSTLVSKALERLGVLYI